MSTINSRDDLRRILFRKVSRIEPEFAPKLIDTMILEMKDEDLIPLIADKAALKAQVERTLHAYMQDFWAFPSDWDDSEDEQISPRPSSSNQARWSPSDDIFAYPSDWTDSEDEQIPTPSSSSNRASWSPGAESTAERDVVVSDKEDLGIFDVPTTSKVSRTVENQDPQVTNDDVRRPVCSCRVCAALEATKEVAGKSSTQSRRKATEFVETIRSPAELNTMKECVTSSAAVQTQEARAGPSQDYGFRNSLASMSAASYVLGARRATAIPVGPVSQKSLGKRVATRPRAPRHDAADHDHPLVETETPASMPLMQVARQAEPPLRTQTPTQRAQQPPRRTAPPANTGVRAQPEYDEYSDAAVCGFLCGVSFTIIFMFIFH